MAQETLKFTSRRCESNTNQSMATVPVWNNLWEANYGTIDVMMHVPSGYINASLICKGHGKKFSNWYRLKFTKAAIEEIAQAITLRGDDALTEHDMLVLIKGGSGPEHAQICGTYAHPMLVPLILAWSNPIFAGGLSMLANETFGLENHVSRASLIDLMQHLNTSVTGGDAAAADDAAEAASKPPKAAKKPKLTEPGMFAIYKRNDDDKFPYQAFEGAVKNVKAAIKQFQKLPVGKDAAKLYSVCDIAPNVKLLGIIKAAGLIKMNNNSFTSAYDEAELMEKITKLSWEKVVDANWCASIQQLREDLTLSSDDSDSDL